MVLVSHHVRELSLQVLQEVLEAMTEAAQKQQQTRDEAQERFTEETSASGCHKQRRKDLADSLGVEETKLQRKQQNLKEAESLRDRWHGEHSVTECKHHVIHTACPGALLQCGSQHSGRFTMNLRDGSQFLAS